MTFKDIRIWSRSMTHREIVSCMITCFNIENYEYVFAYNSMSWLNAFNTVKPHHKIECWKYAIRAYNIHKKYI